MKCLKCGIDIDENWKCCPNCGTSINNSLIKEEKYIPSKQEKIIICITVVCATLSFILLMLENDKLNNIIINIEHIFELTFLITIVYGKIKYPKNDTIKIIFWIALALILLYIFMLVVIMIACNISTEITK